MSSSEYDSPKPNVSPRSCFSPSLTIPHTKLLVVAGLDVGEGCASCSFCPAPTDGGKGGSCRHAVGEELGAGGRPAAGVIGVGIGVNVGEGEGSTLEVREDLTRG